MPQLQGLKARVIGVANEESTALGCASAFHNAGAEVALAGQNAARGNMSHSEPE